jgi:hypothetical protein
MPFRALTLVACVFALTLAGCGCVTLADARARDRALEAENRARAAPDFERAATALGAVIRAESPVVLRTPRPCFRPNSPAGGHLPFSETAPSSDVECIETIAPGQPIYRLVRRGAERSLFVVVAAPYAQYARIALRGRTVYILTPKVTREKVGTKEQCECDGMPRPNLHELTGFVIPESDFYEARAADVPMTVEYVEWNCRAYAT